MFSCHCQNDPNLPVDDPNGAPPPHTNSTQCLRFNVALDQHLVRSFRAFQFTTADFIDARKSSPSFESRPVEGLLELLRADLELKDSGLGEPLDISFLFHDITSSQLELVCRVMSGEEPSREIRHLRPRGLGRLDVSQRSCFYRSLGLCSSLRCLDLKETALPTSDLPLLSAALLFNSSLETLRLVGSSHFAD